MKPDQRKASHIHQETASPSYNSTATRRAHRPPQIHRRPRTTALSHLFLVSETRQNKTATAHVLRSVQLQVAQAAASAPYPSNSWYNDASTPHCACVLRQFHTPSPHRRRRNHLHGSGGWRRRRREAFALCALLDVDRERSAVDVVLMA
jgi:hypothetical protein